MKRLAALAAPLAAALCLTAMSPALAQKFPQQTVQILVPFAAGGAVDIIARSVAEELGKKWGQTPMIENKPGAGGIIASQALIKAPADGHTLMVVANGHPLNQFFYSKLPYDTLADFTPVTQLAASPLVIVAGNNEAAPNLAALLAANRSKEGGLQFGVSGLGTSAHLAGLLIAAKSGTPMTPIPHRSGTQALQTVMNGTLTASINPMLEALGNVRSGNLRALAVTTAKRSSLLPDVPTVAESGIAGFDTGVWWGVVAPAGLPADRLAQIAADIREAVTGPTLNKKLVEMGAVPVGSSPAEFAQFLNAEIALWGPVIKAAKIEMNQ